MKNRTVLTTVIILLLSLPLFAWNIVSEKKITTEGEWSSPAMSPDGTRFFAVNGKRQIVMFDSNGTVLTMKDNTNIGTPVWSPDGKKLAAEMDSAMQPIVVLDASTMAAEYKGEKAGKPCWGADSASFYYVFWKRDHGLAICKLREMNAGGNGFNEIIDLPRDKDSIRSVSCSPKSAVWAFSYSQNGIEAKIYLVNTEEGEKKTLSAGLKGEQVSWSPDGKFIWTGDELIDVSDKTVYADGMPEAENVTWSKDSKKIYYSKEKGQERELACFDFSDKKEETLKTPNFLETAASFSPDGKAAVCIDGRDGNILLIKLQ